MMFPRVVFNYRPDESCDFDFILVLMHELQMVGPDQATLDSVSDLFRLNEPIPFDDMLGLLYAALNRLAPAGFYFGRYGGDRERIGWWPIDDTSRPFLAP